MPTENRYQARRREGKRPASVEFDAPVYERLRSYASRDQRSMNAVVRLAVVEYLDRHNA